MRPASGDTKVMSATQSRLGASAVKLRSTRSGAGRPLSVAAGRHGTAPPADPWESGVPRQPGDVLASDRFVLGLRLRMDPRKPVGDSRDIVSCPDALQQHRVGTGSGRGLAAEPGVVAAL